MIQEPAACYNLAVTPRSKQQEFAGKSRLSAIEYSHRFTFICTCISVISVSATPHRRSSVLAPFTRASITVGFHRVLTIPILIPLPLKVFSRPIPLIPAMLTYGIHRFK